MIAAATETLSDSTAPTIGISIEPSTIALGFSADTVLLSPQQNGGGQGVVDRAEIP